MSFRRCGAFGLLFLCAITLQVQATGDLMGGFVEGEGTSFSVTNSVYQNFTLESSIPVRVQIRSVPNMITLEFDSVAVDAVAKVTLKGLPASMLFHLYRDDLSHHDSLRVNTKGEGAFELELNTHRTVIIQPKPSTLFLREDGWYRSTSVNGVVEKITDEDSLSWDSENRIARLHANINQTIQIEVSNAVMDGRGYRLSGNVTTGIYVTRRKNLIFKNLRIENSTYGIYCLADSSLVENCTFENNIVGLFSTAHSKGSVFSGNTFEKNNLLVPGVGLYIDNLSACSIAGNLFRGNNLAGLYVLRTSLVSKGLVQVSDNVFQANSRAILISGNSQGSVIVNVRGNSISSNRLGIWSSVANDVRIEENTISGNDTGIVFLSTNNSMISNNQILGNSTFGISLTGKPDSTSRDNLIVRNTIKGNTYGLHFDSHVSNNRVFQNHFDNLENFVSLAGAQSVFHNTSRWGGNWWSDWQVSDPRIMNGGLCVDSFPFVFAWSGFHQFPNEIESPLTTITIPSPNGQNGWHTRDVTVALNASDGGSGVWKTSRLLVNGLSEVTRAYSGPFAITANGQNTLSYQSIDRLGNKEEIRTIPVPIDKDAPTLNHSISGTQGDAGWYRSAVTITATTSDPVSRIARFKYQINTHSWIDYTGPVVISNEGVYTVTLYSSDSAGNTTTRPIPFTIDVTPPVPIIAVLPTVHGNGAVTLTPPTANDALAGLITGTTTNPVSYAKEGTYTVRWTYRDRAGNTATQNQTVIVHPAGFDNVPPVPLVDPLPIIRGECGVIVSTVPFANDNTAGVVSGKTTDPLEYTEEGEYAITWTYDDGLGNTSTQTQRVIIRDLSAPVFGSMPTEYVVTVTNPIRGTPFAVPVPEVTDNCDTSPKVTVSQPTLFPVGKTSIIYTATDKSGNESKATTIVRVVYKFGGFLEPIVNRKNPFKLGQTIPVSFRLLTENNVIVSSARARISAHKVGEDEGFNPTWKVGPIKWQSSSFVYNVLNGSYLFLLNTKDKEFSKGEWEIVVELDDGTRHSTPIALR